MRERSRPKDNNEHSQQQNFSKSSAGVTSFAFLSLKFFGVRSTCGDIAGGIKATYHQMLPSNSHLHFQWWITVVAPPTTAMDGYILAALCIIDALADLKKLGTWLPHKHLSHIAMKLIEKLMNDPGERR